MSSAGDGPLLRIVLIEPEIPQNTGNIGRTCVALRSELHLVGRLGFEINDKQLRRAGLDYWAHLTWFHHATQDDWLKHVQDPGRVFYFSTKARRTHTDLAYERGDWLVFGKETKGLDPVLLRDNAERAAQIPLLGPVRSLNLATAVAVVGFEAARQIRPSAGTP